MPIEIRELVIKTTVDASEKEEAKEGESSAGSSGGGGESSEDFNKMKERIISECMNRIMDHLSNDQER